MDIRSRTSHLLLKTCINVLERAMMGKSDPEEYQKRKRPRVEGNQAWFNCGMNDHFVRECPFASVQRESVFLTQ